MNAAAFNIIMWGLVLSCFAAVENYAGAIAIRFFLGVFESAVTPGFALFTSQWYTKKEQGARTGIWFRYECPCQCEQQANANLAQFQWMGAGTSTFVSFVSCLKLMM